MSLQVILFVHQDEDVEFNDIHALNRALSRTSIGEITDYQNNPGDQFQGFLRQRNAKLELACNVDGYWNGYQNYTHVWSAFSQQEAQTIADALKAGKIVFHKEIEGNPDEYWVLTPGSVQKIGAKTLKF